VGDRENGRGGEKDNKKNLQENKRNYPADHSD
jgi:hypothetical protein